MNLVDLIKDQLTSQITGKLSSLLGGSEDQTTMALGAAVPALLSAFSGMASSGEESSQKLTSAINGFDVGALSNLASQLSDNPDDAIEKGNNLLGSLFGNSTLSGLVGALAKFSGLGSGSLTKLLGYVAPLVMGAIAKQFQGKSASPQGLMELFDSQKSNIADAMPAGLSLSDVPGIPGLADLQSGVAAAERTARHTANAAEDAGGSLVKTLLPIGAVLLAAFLLWNMFGSRGAEPDVANLPADSAGELAQADTQITAQKPVVTESATPEPGDVASSPAVQRFTSEVRNVFENATQALGGITDAESAVAALPALNQLDASIATMLEERSQLPAAANSIISKLASEKLADLVPLITKVLAIPGVGEKVEPVLKSIVTNLESLQK